MAAWQMMSISSVVTTASQDTFLTLYPWLLMLKDVIVIKLVLWQATKYIVSDYIPHPIKLASSALSYCLFNDADWSEWCYVLSQTSYKWFHFSSHTTMCTSALKLKHSITKTIWNRLLCFLVYGTPYHLSMFIPTIRKILKKYFKATISLTTILALTICVSMF